MPAALDAFPPALREPIGRFLQEIEPLVPEPVKSVTLYGSLAKGKAWTDTSDVNFLVSLTRGDAAVLDRLAAPLTWGRRAARVSPLVLVDAELERSIAAFPLKFYDIERHHMTLLGEDPFKGRSVPRDRLRESALQSLVNLSLRLKRLYLACETREDLLIEHLEAVLSDALVPLRAVLHSRGGTVPDKREEVLSAVAAALKVSEEPLLRLLASKKGTPLPPGTRAGALFDALHQAVDAAAKAL